MSYKARMAKRAQEKSNKPYDPAMPKEETPKPPMGDEEGVSQDGHSEHDHYGEEGDHEVIKGIVDEHGPANSVQHEHSDGAHSVVSKHEDGHEHSSQGHPTPAHALAHHAYAIGDHALAAHLDEKAPEETKEGRLTPEEDEEESLVPGLHSMLGLSPKRER